MHFQWKALCICTIFIALAKTGDSAPHFGLTKRVLCRSFYRYCPTKPEVPVTEAPCSNPATAAPTAFAAPGIVIPKPPSWVSGSVRRKGELLLSLANLANFIDKEINRNPALSVVRLNLEIEYGLNLPALAAGKLAGKSVHELVRVLSILTEVLSLLKGFPRAPPELHTSPNATVPTSESRGIEGNRNEPPKSSSPPAFDSSSTSTDTVTIASTTATERPMNPQNYPEPPSSSFTIANDPSTISTTTSTVTAAEIPKDYTEPPRSSSNPADDSPAISTTTSTVTTTEIPFNLTELSSSSSAAADDSSAISTITSTVTATEIPMNYPELTISSSTHVVDSTTMATVKPTTAKPKHDNVFSVFPTRPDSGPPQWLDDDDYDYK